MVDEISKKKKMMMMMMMMMMVIENENDDDDDEIEMMNDFDVYHVMMLIVNANVMNVDDVNDDKMD